MTNRPASVEEILGAIRVLTTDGIDRLGDAQRRLLGRVLVDEARKGEFDPRGEPAEVLTRVTDHVRAAFGEGIAYKVVRDHRAKLRSHADRLATEIPPVTSLVLYLTVIEHSVNAMVITASLGRRLTEKDALVVVRHRGLLGKLEWLHERFGLPRLPKELLDHLHKLNELRNGVVHYKWRGQTEAELAKHDLDITEATRVAPILIGQLEAYEHEQLSQDGTQSAKAIFRVTDAELRDRNFQRAI
jgi:hypothetical protein